MAEPDGPAPGWADTALAALMLARAAWRVRVRREGLTRSRAAVATPGAPTGAPTSSTGDAVDLDRARQLAAAVRRAGRLSPAGPSCLTRSLALKELLDARGLEGGRVRVGVRREESRFEAHAWVEYGGRALGDPAHGSGDFATLEGLEVAPDR